MFYKSKLLLGCILSITLFGCNKTGPGTNISNEVRITVLNQDGEDLLDPDNPSAIDLDQVKVYYELNGVKTEINRGNLTYPKMFRIEEPGYNTDKYRVLLFMNIEDDSEITTTYFKWNSERTDVFKSLVERPKGSNGSVYGKKTWFNDEVICDGSVDTSQCEVTITFNN